MKILIVLLLLFSPSTPAGANPVLSCEDFEFLTRNLEETRLSAKQIREIYKEMKGSTDPKCFS